MTTGSGFSVRRPAAVETPLEICNKVTGHCDSGCASGYVGDDCQQVSGTNQGSSIGPDPGTSQATATELMGGATPNPGSNNDGGDITNIPTGGQITAITFAVIVAMVAAVSSLLYFLRWRESKRAMTPDSNYDDLSRPDIPEHRYVTMSDVVRKHSTNSGVKVKTDSEAKCRDSENHYDHVIDSEAFPDENGYLVPIGETRASSVNQYDHVIDSEAFPDENGYLVPIGETRASSVNQYDYVIDSEAFPEDQGYLEIKAPSVKK
ncbi:uncharacterized protein LOC124273547 isoform X2 [Haliotis rubra]|uniref:uncharacterized protein LOC124273547 isoform X2 n=1 Tax=Haliotis rubra TaxID=36100 RepID=UPI001EE60822|nr:uncharacterized protein LOC124273547 isoform X2 [Haliotis rubra]